MTPPPPIIAIAALVVGISLVLRAVAIITIGGRGRFPLDPWVSLIAGFALIFAGRVLLD